MSKLEKYPAYKESGVEWIGEIPEGWEIEKGKRLFKQHKRAIRDKDEIVTCFRDGEVTLRKNRRKDGFTTALKEHGYQGIRKGDFVIHNMDAFAGAIGISDSDGKSTPVYSVCTPWNKEKVSATYYAKYLRNLALQGFIITLAKGIRERSTDFRFNDFGELLFPLPPKQEQTKIASFLDEKTSQLDTAIEQKEQLIKLLKERRQILINDAVTKGLDKTVAMKDSGVEWIGEIPEGWEVKKMKYIFSFSKGLTITKENLVDEGVKCVNYGEIHSKYGFEINPQVHNLKCVDINYLKSDKKSLLNFGDFVYADTSEDIEGSGNFTYLNSNIKTFAGYHTVICRPKVKIDSRFFAYEFDSSTFRYQIQRKVKGVKVYSITQGMLKDISLWIPPLIEQQEIVKIIDDKTSKIDKAIDLQQQQITKLKEYKTTLIDSVVTGKVKVS